MGKKKKAKALLKEFEAFKPSKKYIEGIGNEEWLFKYLIMRQHVVTIIAKPGGGKTAILFRHVCPEMVNKGYEVNYIDADSPAGEHPFMYSYSKEHGFNFIQIHASKKGLQGMLDLLNRLVKNKVDLTKKVYIFDTLKKFAALIQKNDVKDFYALMKGLTALGATVVLLGHANKRRENDGCLMYEGTGDVLADTDDLIYFETTKHNIEDIDVTTVVDPTKNAKVRGIAYPISFNVSRVGDREVVKLDQIVTVPDYTTYGRKTVDETAIIRGAKVIIGNSRADIGDGEVGVCFSDLVDKLKEDLPDAGISKIKSTIKARSGLLGSDSELIYKKGDKNAKWYLASEASRFCA